MSTTERAAHTGTHTKITADQTMIASRNHIGRFQSGVNSSSHKIADECEIFCRQDITVTEQTLFTNNTIQLHLNLIMRLLKT